MPGSIKALKQSRLKFRRFETRLCQHKILCRQSLIGFFGLLKSVYE